MRKLYDDVLHAYGDFFNLQFKMFEDILAPSNSVNGSVTDSFFQALSLPTRLKNLATPEKSLTIFDPDIVHDALNKATRHLHKKLKKNPEHLHQLALNHFEKQQHLSMKTMRTMMEGESPIRSEIIFDSKREKRFQNPLWHEAPYFSYLRESYLLYADLLEGMVDELSGLDSKTKAKITFYTNQLIDALCPTNYAATNPDVIQETVKTGGGNLRRGLKNFIKDKASGHISMTDKKAFHVGKTVAATPGTVVFKNDFLELIYYYPQTETVFETPLLVIPAWINKFYIFDLSPENSFVKWALEKGLQVFMISWINPKKQHQKHSFDDYVLKGLYQAVDAVLKHTGSLKLNAYGYCAGGVLLNCLMAYLKASKIKSPFASATTLAAPMDTEKGGGLLAYICERQIKLMEGHLEESGVISGDALLHSFNLLKPKELMWNYAVDNYLMGKKPKAFDMLFWNSDTTNLPGKMHTEYLRHVFLNNSMLKKGGISIQGTPLDLSKITTPAFIVGAARDHIVPWKSLFPLLNTIQSTHKEFLLTGSGHMAGIMNHPAKQKYEYWANPNILKTPSLWKKNAVMHPGSWWDHWFNWLSPYAGERVKPASHSSVHTKAEPAPGRYVVG